MSAYKKTWSAHKCSLRKCFLHIFIHVIPSSDETSSGKMLHKRILCHTDFKNLERTLPLTLTHPILHPPTLALNDARLNGYFVSSYPLEILSLPWTTLWTTPLIR